MRIKTKSNNTKYYIAYGSNLSVEQMAHRCPDAKVVGTAVLPGWQLLFKGCATIEPNPSRNTPVLIWSISPADEKNLDVYEGFPSYYFKKNLEVDVTPIDGGEPVKLNAMVYIMDEKNYCHAPSSYYYQILDEGYRRFGFDLSLLHLALEDSVGAAETRLFMEYEARE